MPVQPTFAGDASIFGVAPTVVPRPHPPRVQFDAYPGINGRTSLMLGVDGGRTTAEALYVYQAEADLATMESAVIALAAQGPANVGTLVDSFGRSWASVFLADAIPLERVMFDGYSYSRKWRLTFEHLI